MEKQVLDVETGRWERAWVEKEGMKWRVLRWERFPQCHGEMVSSYISPFWLSDMLWDSVGANHFQGLLVPANKRCVIELSFFVQKWLFVIDSGSQILSSRIIG